jgi:GTP-binding protein
VKTKQAKFILSAVRQQDLVADGFPQITFVGRSNVGKSSLLNQLVGRKALAKISSNPGKTRAVNYFLIDSSYYFVDLPGFGYAKASKTDRQAWANLMDLYFQTAEPRPKVIHLLDAKVGATPLDVQAVEYLRHQGIEPAVVATKIDRLSKNKRHGQLASIRSTLGLSEEHPPMPCSSRTGEGVKEIWRAIDAFLRLSAEMAN